MTALRLALVVITLAGCAGGASRVTLEELAFEPETFDVADRVLIRGFPIRSGRGVTFVCSGLTGSVPPRGDGHCVEAEGVPLSEAGGDRHAAGTWWDDARDLDCLVVRRMPVEANPERVVVSCVPEGLRP